MSQNDTSSNYHENCGFFRRNDVTLDSSSNINFCSTAPYFNHWFSNSSFKGVLLGENMTSKGDTPTKSKNLSAGHSGPVIIKAHNLKNRVPLSSLANVGCKKDSSIAANSWMTNATVYSRSDSTAAAIAKPTTDVPEVSVVEPDKPSASDSVEFALQSLFNSDTSIFVSTPNQNPKHMSVESVEKILKSPSPGKSDDDDDVTIVYDSKSSQNVSSNPTCDVKPSVGEPTNVKTTTKVLILRKKNDSTVKSGIVKTGNSTAAKSVTPVKHDRLININSVENTEKNKSDLKKIIDQIPPLLSSSITVAIAKNDSKLENKNINKNFNITKAVNNNSTSQVGPISNNVGDKEGTYVQVENELEKMFAGIEDSLDPSTTMKQLNSSALDAENKLSSPGTQLTLNSHNSSSSVDIPAKTNKKNLPKSSKPSATTTKGVKFNNKRNSSSFSKESPTLEPIKKVPMLHIEGSKENPINAHIINSIKSKEEESSNGKMSVKRKQGYSDPAVKTTTSNFAFKNHNSVSSDATWVCVFCNLSANVPGMAGEAIGDLFGPYFIRMPDKINSEESKIHTWRTSHPEQVMKKQKRSSTDSSSSDEHKSVEIWAHENCIVWAPGVHLIGSKLIGLEEAVTQALDTICTHCSNRGASIGCRARNCNSCAHCSCALHMGWKLDTETFISTCRAHSASPNA